MDAAQLRSCSDRARRGLGVGEARPVFGVELEAQHIGVATQRPRTPTKTPGTTAHVLFSSSTMASASTTLSRWGQQGSCLMHLTGSCCIGFASSRRASCLVAMRRRLRRVKHCNICFTIGETEVNDRSRSPRSRTADLALGGVGDGNGHRQHRFNGPTERQLCRSRPLVRRRPPLLPRRRRRGRSSSSQRSPRAPKRCRRCRGRSSRAWPRAR